MRQITAIALAVVLLITVVASAQQGGTPVQPVLYPYDQPIKFFDYDGSGNLIYTCQTKASGPWNNNSVPSTFSWTRAANTLTSIVDSTNTATVTTSTAHGLQVANAITISGATVDTDLNGTYYIQTVGSTTTFTITTANVTDATYTESTLAVSSTAPRLTVAIWSIFKFTYNGSNQLTNFQMSNGVPAMNQICANRAVTTGATMIVYK